MNIIEELDKAEIERLTAKRQHPDFSPGDTVRVKLKIVEGARERLQAFEGVCIARKNRGIKSSFTVRKISYNEGVERVFSLYSPLIDSIELVRRGDVRRAKLYYLRGRRGKSARISEKTTGAAGKAALLERAAASAAKAAAAKAIKAKDQKEGGTKTGKKGRKKKDKKKST